MSSSGASETQMNIGLEQLCLKKTMFLLPCTLRRVVFVITVMGKVKFLAAVVGEWVVLVMECSIHNAFGAVVREKSNVASMAALVKGNDVIVKMTKRCE